MSPNFYDDIKYNEAQFKASHNSYAKHSTLEAQLKWRANKPGVFGCRGLELDIAQADDLKNFSVSHSLKYKSGPEYQLSSYLKILKFWSDQNPGHDPVTVTLDIKRSRDRASFPLALDAYLEEHFDSDRLFKPGGLMVPGKGLVASANQKGWPTLGALKRTFIFVLSGSFLGDGKKTKRLYAKTDPGNRLCFSDRTVGTGKTTIALGKGNRVFLNFDMGGARNISENEISDGRFTSDEINRLFRYITGTKGLISRGFGLNAWKDWRVAQGLGVNILGTDSMTKGQWAKVGAAPFAKRLFTPLI